MPIIGNWYDQAERPLIKDVQDVETSDLATSGVTTAKIAALNVTSEKLSVNALRRSVATFTPALAQQTQQTSAFEIWRPSRAVILVGARMVPQADWTLTTVQTTPVLTLFAGDDAVASYNVDRESPPTAGVSLSFGTVSAAVAAGTALTLKIANTETSTGTAVPAHVVQLDYDTSA